MTAAFGLHPQERTAIFIDGPNLYAASKALGFDMDYKTLLASFSQQTHLMRAHYYTAVSEDEDDYVPLRPLLDYLDYNGFTMVTKPMREFTDDQGRRRNKGNMDVEMTVDMLHVAYEKQVDHIVVFSGDGNLRRAVEAVMARGVRVSVVSTLKGDMPMVADELRRQADNFYDLASYSTLLARKPREVAPVRR